MRRIIVRLRHVNIMYPSWAKSESFQLHHRTTSKKSRHRKSRALDSLNRQSRLVFHSSLFRVVRRLRFYRRRSSSSLPPALFVSLYVLVRYHSSASASLLSPPFTPGAHLYMIAIAKIKYTPRGRFCIQSGKPNSDVSPFCQMPKDRCIRDEYISQMQS